MRHSNKKRDNVAKSRPGSNTVLGKLGEAKSEPCTAQGSLTKKTKCFCDIGRILQGTFIFYSPGGGKIRRCTEKELSTGAKYFIRHKIRDTRSFI